MVLRLLLCCDVICCSDMDINACIWITVRFRLSSVLVSVWHGEWARLFAAILRLREREYSFGQVCFSTTSMNNRTLETNFNMQTRYMHESYHIVVHMFIICYFCCWLKPDRNTKINPVHSCRLRWFVFIYASDESAYESYFTCIWLLPFV